MKAIRVLSIVLVCSGLAVSPHISAAEEEDGFITIFDGKTLRGWEESPARDVGAWEVKEGAIVGDGDKGVGYLVYENHELSDFELKFSYRFPGEGNSGVSVRAVADETGKRKFKSYHADLGHLGIGKQVNGAWDFHTPGRKEHACHRGDRLVIDEEDRATVTKIEGGVSEEDIHKGEWNTAHVIAKGNRFQFFINGKLSSEFTEHLPEAKRLRKGMIQLQLHDPGMTVQFKDLRLKILLGDEERLAELDALWAEVSRSVNEGDFEGYAATCHETGILVSGVRGNSAPLSDALKRWKSEFDATKAGDMKAGVDFRFSQRFGDDTTAHETGMFLYSSGKPDGKWNKEYIHFEALLLKEDGKWKILMEYQKSVGTVEEWDALARER